MFSLSMLSKSCRFFLLSSALLISASFFQAAQSQERSSSAGKIVVINRGKQQNEAPIVADGIVSDESFPEIDIAIPDAIKNGAEPKIPRPPKKPSPSKKQKNANAPKVPKAPDVPSVPPVPPKADPKPPRPKHNIDKDLNAQRRRLSAIAARMEEGPVDFLLLGDSFIQGWEAAGENAAGYYGQGRLVLNMGFDHDTPEHLLRRLEILPMEKIRPKGAMLLIGNNAILPPQEQTAQQIADGIGQCVSALRERYPKMPIILVFLFNPLAGDQAAAGSGYDRYGKTVDEVNALLPQITGDDPLVTLFDLNPVWQTSGAADSAELFGDFIHPTEKCYALWGAVIEPLVAELLGDTPKQIPAEEPQDEDLEEDLP